jgi:hypothetical protein
VRSRSGEVRILLSRANNDRDLVDPGINDLIQHQPQRRANLTPSINKRLKWQTGVMVTSRRNDGFANFHAIALDVKSTIDVTSAESAEVQMPARADHRNNCRMSQVLFEKGIAILLQAENLNKRMKRCGICCRFSTGNERIRCKENVSH